MKLIINADDFGLSKSVTDGIIEGIKAGVITSTTIMANMEWANYAIIQAQKNKIKCIGLHTNLTIGKPLTNCPSLCDDNGNFLYIDKQALNNKIVFQEAYNEIMAQIKFVECRKLKLTHIDRHHSINENPILEKARIQIAKELNLPMRREESVVQNGIKTTDVLSKQFFGKSEKGVSVETIENIICEYKNTHKVVEIMSHAGYIDDYTRSITSYRLREEELAVLLKCKEKGLFKGIKMISYEELK